MAVHYHVGILREVAENLAASVAFDVEGYAALIGIVVPEEKASVQSGLVLIEWLVSASGIATPRFHLDYVGAHIGEELSAPSPDLTANLQHSNVIKNALPHRRFHFR